MRFHSRRNKSAGMPRSVRETSEHRTRSAADGIWACLLTFSVAAVLPLLVLSGEANADTFARGDNSFEIDFVTIGDPGNAADTTGRPRTAGAVDYVYRIGKYEISRDMVDKANAEGDLGIRLNSLRSVRGGPRPDMPATGVSWNEGARFINWLNASEGFSPAYKFATQPGDDGYSVHRNILLWQAGDPGFDAANPFRNSLTQYFLPSMDEWYKAAYFDPNTNDGAGGYWDYPTGSDSMPTRIESGNDPGTAVYSRSQTHGPADITQAGGLSPYGVMAMGGNIFEWEETEYDLVNSAGSSDRGVRGANWFFPGSDMSASVRKNVNPRQAGINDVVGIRVAGKPVGEALVLQAGDADQDHEFDQMDLVQVQVAARYLTGQAATWGEGDWNGAPGGSPGNPPSGDGLFDQFDIIAAQQAGAYLTGTYAAIRSGGQSGDGQTSLVYFPATGELAVDAPAGVELTSINIESASGIFTGDAAQNLGGSFDNDSDGNIFKATFGSSFGSISFGSVAQAGLSEEVVFGDLSVVGSLAGGGDLGDVDLIYVPEPSTVWLLLMAIVSLAAFRCKR